MVLSFFEKLFGQVCKNLSLLVSAASSFSITSKVSVDLTSLRVRISDSASSRSLLYYYVIDDALLIAAVDNGIHAGYSGMFSDGLLCRFLQIFIHLYQYKRLSHTCSKPSLSLFDTVFDIVFINKKDLLILLYWVIFYICRQLYDPYKAGERFVKKLLKYGA